MPVQPVPFLEDCEKREWWKSKVGPKSSKGKISDTKINISIKSSDIDAKAKANAKADVKAKADTKADAKDDGKAEVYKKITDPQVIKEMILKYSKKDSKSTDQENDDEPIEEEDEDDKNNYSMQDAHATKDTYWSLLRLIGGLKIFLPFFSLIVVRNTIDFWKERSFVTWTQ